MTRLFRISFIEQKKKLTNHRGQLKQNVALNRESASQVFFFLMQLYQIKICNGNKGFASTSDENVQPSAGV